MLALCPFLALPALAWLLSLAGTALALTLLKKFQVMDAPTARSNHTVAVPRGGGIAMIASALMFLWLAGAPVQVLLAASLLALVSFADDLRPVAVRVRLLAQWIAVFIALEAMHVSLLPAIVPAPAQWAFCALLWVWFINLTNFMDGIDGITAMQTMMMCGGLCLFGAVHPFAAPLPLYGAIIAAAAFGFYPFNRAPAKLFMGDVGSITLGFLLGYLLLSLATSGAWQGALILPAYYLSDATWTLWARLRRGEKIWQAHSQHAYQRAVRSGMTHSQVVWRIAQLNAVLIALAIVSMRSVAMGYATLVAAYVITAFVMQRFSHAPLSR